MRIFKDIIDKKGETYSVIIELDPYGKITPKGLSCTCKYGSFYGWSKKNQARKTLCRHILQVLKQEGIELPERFKTTRNIKIMESFK